MYRKSKASKIAKDASQVGREHRFTQNAKPTYEKQLPSSSTKSTFFKPTLEEFALKYLEKMEYYDEKSNNEYHEHRVHDLILKSAAEDADLDLITIQISIMIYFAYLAKINYSLIHLS